MEWNKHIWKKEEIWIERFQSTLLLLMIAVRMKISSYMYFYECVDMEKERRNCCVYMLCLQHELPQALHRAYVCVTLLSLGPFIFLVSEETLPRKSWARERRGHTTHTHTQQSRRETKHDPIKLSHCVICQSFKSTVNDDVILHGTFHWNLMVLFITKLKWWIKHNIWGYLLIIKNKFKSHWMTHMKWCHFS